jgi:hypothetical protein
MKTNNMLVWSKANGVIAAPPNTRNAKHCYFLYQYRTSIPRPTDPIKLHSNFACLNSTMMHDDEIRVPLNRICVVLVLLVPLYQSTGVLDTVIEKEGM